MSSLMPYKMIVRLSVLLAVFQGPTHAISIAQLRQMGQPLTEVSCRPDRFPTLQLAGFCAQISELHTRCGDRHASRSSADCGHVEGSFCCYLSRMQGNVVLDQDAFSALMHPKVQQTEAVTSDVAVPPAPAAQNEVVPSQVAPVVQAELAPSTEAPTVAAESPPATDTPTESPPPPAPVVQLTVDPNPPCDSVNDCPDAGMTCSGGRCACWSQQGPQATNVWSCSDDSKCRRMFPGHVCRPTKLCETLANTVGFCQPEGSIKQ
ncbi:hypothetical protein BV898_10297 [Hypsibius exemplaris]|uniref:Uncharacterized protein n=1 Tax=Hypsibius exemplaris TaxID=2072580 RepID=A0A1W0WK73_HYPEX|nr:hypothetical protein BV898_10297 [Hypsibius exemplaris]